MQFSEDVNDLDSIGKILGYPAIDVNLEYRGIQCPNCGSHEHSSQNCPHPKMEQLLEKFGSACYDSTPSAVEAKKKIVEENY